MRKTLVCLLIIAAMLATAFTSFAEIDYSGMTLEELLEARDALDAAIDAAQTAAEASETAAAAEEAEAPEAGEAAEKAEAPGADAASESDEAPEAAAADTSMYTLMEKGSKGDEVKALQTRLFDLGFYNKGIDGDYGNGTVRAIQEFEEYNGLEPTGIASPELQAFLFSDGAKAKPIEVASIKIDSSVSRAATVLVGGTLDLKEIVAVSPENATEKGLSFEIDSDEFADLSADGVLSGKLKGALTVTITSKENVEKPKTATLKVNVSQPVKSITLDETEFNVGNGDSRQLNAEVGPEEADDKSVVWESQDPEIATVSKNGSVKGVGTGSTTITCTAGDGSGVSASATVTVITAVKKITAAEKSITLIDDDSSTISVEVTPEDATNPRVVWSSSDTSIATVSASGTVTAQSAGTCVISAEAEDGTGAKAEITVYVEPHLPLMVNSINWQTTWGQKNGKMGVEVESFCTNKTIKSFDYTVECYNMMGTSATSYLTYEGSSIKPGGTGKSKLTRSSVSGFTSAYKVEVTPTKVYFSDGTEATIPSSYRYTSTFMM